MSKLLSLMGIGRLLAVLTPIVYASMARANEASLVMPDLNIEFAGLGNGRTLLMLGLVVGVLGIGFGLIE